MSSLPKKQEEGKAGGVDETQDEALWSTRVTELGFARTVSIAQTITPQTLALLKTVNVDASVSGVSAREPATSPKAQTLEMSPADLPRISVDERKDLPTGASTATHRPDYAIVSTLGEGGMGRVHLARQRSLERDVALKTLKPGATPTVAAALLREARLTGSLEHPGVIPVHVLGLDENERPMLVMKRVDGVDLGTLLADDSHPSWRTRGRSADRLVASLEILTQVCLTIEFAHSRGIIHRDIKPENIMVGGFGEVYLVDWGIATTMTSSDADDNGNGNGRQDELVGTPVYMAPEMALGRRVDERTDVYLLGATLHEMLTGRVRHEGKTIFEVLRSAMTSKPFDYGDAIPEELARLCNRATHRNPAKRPASAEELREEIAAFFKHRSARALSDAAFERLRELEKMLATPSSPSGTSGTPSTNEAPQVPKDLARAYRLETEARFSLTESLREQALASRGSSEVPSSRSYQIVDNTARSGMRRCLALAIELELRQEHADTAEALLREMDTPDPELMARIEQVRARSEAHAREHERLELLERDLDPTEQSSKRGLSLLLFGMLILTCGSLAGVFAKAPTPTTIMFASAIATSVLCIIVLVIRRTILTNLFNRRLGALVMLSMITVLIHRVLALIMGAPVGQTMAIDHLIYAAMLISASITLMPQLGYCALPFTLGMFMTWQWPEQSAIIFVSVTGIALVLAAFILKRAKGRRSKELASKSTSATSATSGRS